MQSLGKRPCLETWSLVSDSYKPRETALSFVERPLPSSRQARSTFVAYLSSSRVSARAMPE